MAIKESQLNNYWRNFTFWASGLSALVFTLTAGINAFIEQRHDSSTQINNVANEFNYVMVCTGTEKISNNLNYKEESEKTKKTFIVRNGYINNKGCSWGPDKVFCEICWVTEFLKQDESPANLFPTEKSVACKKEVLKRDGIIVDSIHVDRYAGSIRASNWKRINNVVFDTEFVGTCEKVKEKSF